ncbi:MAG: DUF885 domain-containing protein [Polyangiaceae bacterium]
MLARNVVFALAVALAAGCSSPPAPVTTGAAPSSAIVTADAAFDDVWARLLDGYLRREPVEATTLGMHDHDGLWPDRSVEGEREARAFYDGIAAELDALPASQLSPDRRIDLGVLQRRLESIAFARDVLRVAERDPLATTSLIGAGLEGFVSRTFAPAPVRARHLAERLATVGPIVAAARARLTRPSKIATETAIKQVKGLVALVRSGFPELLPDAPSERDAVLAAAKKAEVALRDLQQFFEGELLARSDGDFRAGRDAYMRSLALTLDDDVDGEALVAAARASLAATQKEMADTALELWPEVMKGQPVPSSGDPHAAVRAVLAKLADEHPTTETLVADAKGVLDETTRFVKEQDLVTVPTEPCKVMEMPEWERGVAIAYCEWPGALEENGETLITLSPAPLDWTPERRESFYREYNDSMLQDLIIHEAMPGHYLQAWHANQFHVVPGARDARAKGGAGRRAAPREVFDNGAFVEGWAVYGEWLMARHGFGGARVRIERQKMFARVCVNAILDHDIHAGTLDEKGALDLMENEGFQEEGEAIGKWTRARLGVGQLSSYFYGFSELIKLRERAEREPGFSERAYHDKLLGFGAPSVHAIRALMGM